MDIQKIKPTWPLWRRFRSVKPACSPAAQRFALPAFISLVFLLAAASPVGKGLLPQKQAEFFKTTNVWTAHLKFTSEQWEAMEPKGGMGPFGGPGGFGGRGGPGGFGPAAQGAPAGFGRGGQGGPGGPAGPGGFGPGGPGGFGPAMFLAPIFQQQGDQDHDGKLSREEFRALGEKWFGEWDKEKRGQLSAEQMRAGLNTTVPMPAFGPPGRGGPGGGGPGRGFLAAEGERNGLAGSMGIEFEYVHADLEFDGHLLKDVAVRYKGNGTFMESRGSSKRSLKIELNKYEEGQKLAGMTKLNLHNNVTDASWMNEVLSYRLFRDAGVPAGRTAYARVYVTVPGKYNHQYFGLYSLVENIDKHFEHSALAAKGGAIFKPVTRELFGYLGDDWAKYKQTYDPKTELSEAQQRRVIEFAKLVTNAPDSEFATKLGDYLDLDEFARFMSVTVWLSTIDSILAMGQNFYVYLHPETGKFQFLPWDLDHSFGQFPMGGSQEQRENLSIQRPWQGDNRFLERVFQVAAFKKLYLAKLNEFSQTVFKPERFHQQVDEVAAAIRSAVQEESPTMLARFDKVVAGESVERVGFGGPPGAGPDGRGPGGQGPRFGGPGGFMQPPKPIKAFVDARAQSVRDQLAGKSEGQVMGFGFGPGGPGGPGARGGRGGPGGPGGPGFFGPGMFLGEVFLAAFDSNKNGEVTHDEFAQGFARWFKAWNTDQSGVLTDEQLRAGINRDLSPFRGGPPGGFGPPGGPPPFDE